MTLARARVHEICGGARRTLALALAAEMDGPVFWIAPAWAPERLNPTTALHFIDPGRLIFLRPKRAEDLLWTMEECLRSGTVPLVIADIPGLPRLTPVRRLHLAAETGATEGSVHPLGVLLTPGDGGAEGVESRWHLAFAHEGDRAMGWRLERRRARAAPPAAWSVRPGARTPLALGGRLGAASTADNPSVTSAG
ncbi:MAG: hypothetical protein AAFR35_11205 [Pseudomonadota bacterium]